MPRRTQKGIDDATVQLTDARAIRALAHPARLAIIDALYLGRGELTATECAGLTGLSPSATSYHLRALERWGIVVRAPTSGDGRERPWRAAGTRLHVTSDDPRATGAAESALLDLAFDRDRAAARAFLAHQDSEPPEWRDALDLSVGEVWLTVDELHELTRSLRGSLDAFRDRRRVERRPPGARQVRVSIVTAPLGSPPQTGDSA